MSPLGTLEYLYVGSADVERDLAHYRDAAGAEVVWDLTGFGHRVAAVRLLEGPLLLLADHRPAPSVLPVVAVPSLPDAVRTLRERGWAPSAGPFEIPNGPCVVFRDPSGNEIALFENVRPRPFEDASGNP